MRFIFKALFLISSLIHVASWSQISLLGDNIPFENINDGDFELVNAYWRQAKQSPFWETKAVKGKEPLGIHYGTLFCSNDIGEAKSIILNTNANYPELGKGDIWYWDFSAYLEYDIKAYISLSLVFGEEECTLIEKASIKILPEGISKYSGEYKITASNVKKGFPYLKVTFYSKDNVKIYLEDISISVSDKKFERPKKLRVSQKSNNFIGLQWDDGNFSTNDRFQVYRKSVLDNTFLLVDETNKKSFVDRNIVSGVTYDYLIIRKGKSISKASNVVTSSIRDLIPPEAPKNILSRVENAEVILNWKAPSEEDIYKYSIYRSNDNEHFECIAKSVYKTSYKDDAALKSQYNFYKVSAHDFSGNESITSETTQTRLSLINGASFIDLIEPMPIISELTTDTWGVEDVIPRDIENGIEDKDWSYWGGHPILGEDNKYHLPIVRWPANDLKGHWEWPNSTVAYAVSETPIGPYVLKRDLAYDYKKGFGHNADVVLLNDGSYLLYSLVDWKPTLFSSKSMNGPWKLEGEMKIEYDAKLLEDDRKYQVERNLSGVQLEDGSLLFMTKFGRVIKSDEGILGPYKVLTDVIQKNNTIPKRYRNLNYEDPTIWKDDVQFHCLINGFLDKRAIYLRSPDGIHWECDPGLGYNTSVTSYENGVKNHWYKLERPHVIQDRFGRATHLSLATLDVPKKEDRANDNHNSKNIILPLVVHKRIKLLDEFRINERTKDIRILIQSEEGFDAQKDLDIESLRFGSSKEVNIGKGSKVKSIENKDKDLIVTFHYEESGISINDWVYKLLGNDRSGNLIIAFCKPYKSKLAVE